MDIQIFTIRKNSDRYPGICPSMPEEFHVSGVTGEQADQIAERLTNHEAGCDWAWYRVGGPADE